ncbi:MAG TPA: RluA family pseudouridine synthase [Chroococcales cyanobacterium]|jgi:23S rRNA pseudouridine1911/1915/1917 synthase
MEEKEIKYFLCAGGFHERKRLDVYLAECLETDRLAARNWIVSGFVLVDGKKGKPSLLLWPGAKIEVLLPPPRPAQAVPEDLPLEIFFEDEALVVVNKAAGMPCHPGPGWWHGGLVNALLFHCSGWTGIGGEATPGIVHRLDKETTGLVVYAKGEIAHKRLLEAMRERRIERRYDALCEGRLEGEGTIDLPLKRDGENSFLRKVDPEGKRAVTHWRALYEKEGKTALSLRLETGRTHQIRVHLAHVGHPICGDALYGKGDPDDPSRFMALHSSFLAFDHPLEGRRLEFSCPAAFLPKSF